MGSMAGPTGPSAGTSGRLPGLLEELHRTGRVSSPPSRRSRLSSAALLLFALVAATGAVGTCVLGIRDGRLEDAIGGAGALGRVLLPARVLQLGIGGAVSPEDLAVLAMEARALR